MLSKDWNNAAFKLKPEQMAKIESAIDKAAAKGAKDSLILFKDMAFIVNVNNRTIVTAMDGHLCMIMCSHKLIVQYVIS